MTLSDSLLVAIFCIATVFVLLLCIYLIIRAFSFICLSLGTKRIADTEPQETAKITEETFIANSSCGELSLINVDEKTAAMIMAIVSDESNIPLSELNFKSIRLIDKNNL